MQIMKGKLAWMLPNILSEVGGEISVAASEHIVATEDGGSGHSLVVADTDHPPRYSVG